MSGQVVTGEQAEMAARLPDLAVVAFTGRATLAWLRLLRPGFRHCFVLLRTAEGWAYLDPMSHFTFAAAVGAYPLRPLLRFLRGAGCRTLLVRPRLPPPRPQPWRPYTCVEAVKRALGLRAPWVLTPWQLYRRLLRERGFRPPDGRRPGRRTGSGRSRGWT